MKTLFLFFLLITTSLSFGREVKNLSELSKKPLSITKIDLSNKGLTEFPFQILECKNVVEINLSNNGITKLPLGVSMLEKLKNLNLSTNQGLDINSLDLILKDAVFELTSINLANCDLIFCADELGKQTTLKNIDLSHNNLKTLPYSYTKLNQLNTANLSDNYFTDISWLIKFWWNIQNLNLINNKDYKTDNLLFELSFFDNINKVKLSNLVSFSSLKSIPITDFTLKNSFISNFNIEEKKNSVKRIKFSNCQFDLENIEKNTSLYQHYDFVSFEFIDNKYLMQIKLVNADSIVFKNCDLTKNMFENLNDNVSFIDVRSAKVDDETIKFIQNKYPNIKISTKENVPLTNTIKPPFAQVKIPTQSLNLNALNGDTLSFDNTKIMVPANAFKTKNGQIYNGKVNVKVREFMTPEDIFFSGIPMGIEEDGETFMFSSGGMIEINALTENGDTLDLNKNLTVAINTNSTDDNMNLYYLDENGVWQNKGKDKIIQPFRYDTKILDSIAGQNFRSMVNQNVLYVKARSIPSYTKLKRSNSFTVDFTQLATSDRIFSDESFIYIPHESPEIKFLSKSRLKYYGDSAKFYMQKLDDIKKECKTTYKEIYLNNSKDYTVNGPEFINDIELVPDFEKDVFLLNFTFKGEKISIPMILNLRNGRIKTELRYNKRFFDQYKRAIRKRENSKRKGQFKVNAWLNMRAKNLKESVIEREKKRQKLLYENQALFDSKVSETSLSRVFQISNFGIFNCDVKSRMKSPKVVGNKFYGKVKIENPPQQIIVIDYDINGTVTFNEPKKAFFDKASASIIVVFFTQTLVGIYKTWVNKNDENGVEVKLLNTKGMTTEQMFNMIHR